MAILDRKYLNALIHDAKQGSADAMGAIFTGTVEEEYRRIWEQVPDTYRSQDILISAYASLFTEIGQIRTANQLYASLRRLTDDLCAFYRVPESDAAEKAGKSGTESSGETGGSEDAPKMTPDLLQEILTSIFEMANLPANETPIETLMSYNKYRSHRYLLQRIILLVLVATVAVIPTLFIRPNFIITEGKTDAKTGSPSFLVTVRTPIIPVRSVTATVSGENMPVYRSDRNTFRIEPTRNGDMIVTVTLSTTQSSAQKVTVSGIDLTAPTVTDTTYKDGVLTITADDAGSGLDFDSISLTDEDGKEIALSSADEKTGTFTFRTSEKQVFLSITDKAGNTLRATLHLNGKS